MKLENRSPVYATCNSTISVKALQDSSVNTIVLKGTDFAIVPDVAMTWPKTPKHGEEDPVFRDVSRLARWILFLGANPHDQCLLDFLCGLYWIAEIIKADRRAVKQYEAFSTWIFRFPSDIDDDSLRRWMASIRRAKAEEDVLESLYIKAPGATLFRTGTGHIGITFGAIKEGNTIALLAGAEYPVVLRCDGENCWDYIGPAYIVRIMTGNAWPKDKDTDEMETFVLR